MALVSVKQEFRFFFLNFILDIFFLNRQSMRNVKNAEELIPVFAVPPAG